MAIFNTVPPLVAGAGIKFDGERISTAAAPRNLLDNSDFRNPVNQRGVKTVTASGYSIDRWAVDISASGAANFEYNDVRLYAPSGYASIYQAIEKPELISGKAMTFAVANNSGNVYVLNFVGGTNTSMQKGHVSLIFFDKSLYIRVIESSNWEGFLWAALYEGEYTEETLPEYQPKGYGAELAECQRYYTKGKVIFQRDPNIPTVLITNHEYPNVMRVTPAISFGPPYSFTDGQKLNATLSNHFYNNASGLLSATISADPVVNTVIADFNATADL